MGCLKLSYQPQERVLERTSLFLEKGLEKNGSGSKNRVRRYRYGFNGQERTDELKGAGNHYTAPFWEYDPRLARRWNIDPVVKHDQSGFSALANNPIWFVDYFGDDTNRINSDGSQTVVNDGLNSHTYTYETEDGSILNLGTFESNENGLIKLNDYSFNHEDIDIGFKVKTPSKSYVDPNVLGTLLGALIQNNINDLTITGASTSTGTSPWPSKSHVKGLALDLRYLRIDKSGSRVLLGDRQFDMNRQESFVKSMFDYGFTKALTEHYQLFAQLEKIEELGIKTMFNKVERIDHVINMTSHYNKSRHHNHIHFGGKWAGRLQYSPRIYNQESQIQRLPMKNVQTITVN
jgi:hypothetical protein